MARRAVVRIDISFFEYSYDTPYRAPAVRRASGTGFIIAGKRILTNAHVVSQSNTIRLHRPDQRQDYPAHIVFIAHDCDLALLEADDDAFYKDTQPLEIGVSPELNSPVVVVGFPIGGDRVSITRGVVSRKDMDTYAHSTVDSHATIQVDAAINPGNSGGPALQNDKVIGVAFQSLTRGENLGYLIPPEVIRKFLTDVSDGRYDGYIDFGTMDMTTKNPILRSALGLDADSVDTGVLVYDVLQGSSADGFIERGDVLLQVNGKKLSFEGEVDWNGGLHPYIEMLDNLASGTIIEVELLRKGKKVTVKFPARKSKVVDALRINYDTAPPYWIEAGHVFQPLDANLMQQNSRNWAREGRADLTYYYNNFLSAGIYRSVDGFVMLTQRLADPSNIYNDRFVSQVVESVNGEKVKSFTHFSSLMAAAHKEPKITIRFRDSAVPLVLETASLSQTNERIRKAYGLTSLNFVPGEKK